MSPLSLPRGLAGRTGLLALARACVPALMCVAGTASAAPLAANTLEAEAGLGPRGWIAPLLRPAPAAQSGPVPGALAAESWYVAPPSPFGDPPAYQVGAAAFARSEQRGSGTAQAELRHGTAALARAVASETGRSVARLSATWQVDVVINPYEANPLFGLALHQRLIESLDCPLVPRLLAPAGMQCNAQGQFSFLHVTQGSFLHSAQANTGRAHFEESLNITSSIDQHSLLGGATFTPGRSAGPLGVQWSGGWSDADAAAVAPHSGSDARLFPEGDARNALPDPNGLLSGVRLSALSTFTLSSPFQVNIDRYQEANLPLPYASFELTLFQEASAEFDFHYGNGTIAANFDDTSITRLLGLGGLNLTGPDGQPIDLAPWLQVHLRTPSSGPPVTAVGLPATASLLALGVLALGGPRRRVPTMHGATGPGRTPPEPR